MAHHAEQQRLWRSRRRFAVVPAGRRTGKTELAKRKVVREAFQCPHLDGRYALTAPVHLQAKRIFWRDLKALIPRDMLETRPSESELSIRLINGVEIFVCGLDVPARIEGPPLDGIVLDEYGNMSPRVWTEHVRPMLAERKGWAWFIGAPEGRNHYYDLYGDAGSDESGEWGAYTWTMSDVLPLYLGEEQAARELDQMRHDMDALTFDQEANASFVSFEGRCYYSFTRETHVRECKHLYDDLRDLILCFDFNWKPGTATVIQEIPLEDNATPTTCVIGEVYIPLNSNTPLVCRALLRRWGEHKGRVLCYGDATGGAKGSAKVAGSDWDLIREVMRPRFPNRIRFRVPPGNPLERPRINSVNSRLTSAAGDVGLVVDPTCKYTARDFEGVQCNEAGEIDKSDKQLTHLTDGIGYYIYRAHASKTQNLETITI